MVFLHPAFAHEGLILLILHIHTYFRYNKTKKYIERVQDISSYTFRAKKWGEIEQTKQQQN